MAVKTIVEDYLFAAMTRGRGARAENGTLILMVSEFPGIVACGPDAVQCFNELHHLLGNWVRSCLQQNVELPILQTDAGQIDLNTPENRALVRYHQWPAPSANRADRTYIGGPDELEAYFSELDRSP